MAQGRLAERLESLPSECVKGRPGAVLFLGTVSRRRPEGDLHSAGRLGADRAEGREPDERTLFELASLSKPFTALLLEHWITRLPWLAEACCGDLLPPGAPPMADALRRVPLRAIAGFTSGLPADNVPGGVLPDYLPDLQRQYGVDELFCHAADPGFVPAEVHTGYTYSSLGFALLAETLALAADESGGFPRLLASSVLEPLGLLDTGVLDEAARRRLPPCLDRDNRRVEPGAGGFPAHYGSSGVVSTPADLLAWLRFQMGYRPGHRLSMLLPNLQQPVTDLRTPSGLEAGRGWFLKQFVTAVGPRRVLLKSGGLEAFTCFMAFTESPRPGLLPSSAGVFLLSNAHCDVRSLGMEALRILIEDEAGRPIVRSKSRQAGAPRVSFGLPTIVGQEGHAAGGIVKFQPLARRFPNHAEDFDVLCLVSSRLPPGAVDLARSARAAGARLIYNQAGSATPETYGDRWQELNCPLVELLGMADHVIYQSQYARDLADRHLGRRHGPCEILRNAVDTRRFVPSANDPDPRRDLVLLGGSQYRWYRLETALRALKKLRRRRPGAHLLVTGQMVWIPDQGAARRQAVAFVEQLGLGDHVTFLGSYTQRQAPEIFHRAHVLLHPTYLDCCPTVVLEAMASGLPVVYGASGGVPELVGDAAGFGVTTRGHDGVHGPPEPVALAEALDRALERRREMGDAGRRRAVERFDLKPWLDRYARLIHELATRGT